MKPITTISVAVFLATLSTMANASGLIVAVSPYQDADSAEQQTLDLLLHAANREAGSQTKFIDGYRIETLAPFTVPTAERYRHVRARLNANPKATSALLSLAKNPLPAGVDGHPSVQDALRVPQLLQRLGETHPAGTELDLLIIGSALYDDPSDPAVSMADGLVPNDGHINAAATASPFGMAHVQARFRGVRVHWVHDTAWVNDQHRQAVHRFWSLIVAAHGAELVSFSSDLSGTLQRIQQQTPINAVRYTRNSVTKLEMMEVRLPPVSRALIHERPITQAPLALSQLRRAEAVEVGITWNGCQSCDVDIYAQPMPGADVLYYGNVRTAHGQFWKDWQSSPELAQGQETISFRGALDLRALRLAVNFYGGQAPSGITGEIRLAVGNNTYAKAFVLTATAGNEGADVGSILDGKQPSDAHTLQIDPLAIVGAVDRAA